MKNRIPQIRCNEGGDRKEFNIGDCNDGKFVLIMEEIPFNQRYGETIKIEITSKRLEQLANDILNYLNKKTKWDEWKPTLDDFKNRLKQEYRANAFAIEMYVIDWVREAVSMHDKNEILEARRMYEWFKSNEKWLYETHQHLVCQDCGWKSEEYPLNYTFIGLGGQLPCPECTKAKRNRNIEVYGNVDVVIE